MRTTQNALPSSNGFVFRIDPVRVPDEPGKQDTTKLIVQKSTGQSGAVPIGVVIESYTANAIRTSSRIASLNTSVIASNYETSWALLDRSNAQQGEIELTKGDKLRVYARCAYWCFVAKEKSLECGVRSLHDLLRYTKDLHSGRHVGCCHPETSCNVYVVPPVKYAGVPCI